LPQRFTGCVLARRLHNPAHRQLEGQIVASARFKNYEQNLKRQFWMNLVDARIDETRRQNFRASLVTCPITQLPFGNAASDARPRDGG
jgi:hypothetical protein